MPGVSKPLRLLVVCPSWLGDCVMATPACRALREELPGAFIGALVRPGMEELFAGLPFFDELHVARSSGVMGPKFVAAKVRPRRYDTTLLLTNSFSSALTVRIAGIPRRVGYDRDARGLLLTDRLKAPLRANGKFAPIPAVEYYLAAAGRVLGSDVSKYANRLSLFVTPGEENAADAILAKAGISPQTPRVILNPGGNNGAKRWLGQRFGALARHLSGKGFAVLINGSPGEADLVDQIAAEAGVPCICLPRLGITIGALKALVRGSRLMVTNDTGPRHIAAAFGVPLVTLFGPTDPRWTTIPARETVLFSNPDLPPEEVADEHAAECRIERIGLEAVIRAAEEALAG